MGCSWPLLKENCTRQYLCSCPPGTGTKIKYLVRPQTVHIFNAHLFYSTMLSEMYNFLCRHLTPNNIKVSLKLNLYKWWRGYRGELKKRYLAWITFKEQRRHPLGLFIYIKMMWYIIFYTRVPFNYNHSFLYIK